MLLKSIVNARSYSDYFHPLAYYDQAQPMMVSFFHHLVVHVVSARIEVLRLATLCMALLISFPIYFVIKKEKISLLLGLAVFLCFALEIGFYFTEIKHYAFEIAASFFMISIFYFYHVKRIRFAYSIVLVVCAASIGFSSLIPAFFLVAVLGLRGIIKNQRQFFSSQNVFSLVIAGVIGLALFLHMGKITVYQINNYEVYLSKGFFADAKDLLKAGVNAHGILLSIVTAAMCVLGLQSDKKNFYFYLSSIFLLLCMFIFAGKIIGFYPVVSARHLVWITPFSFCLVVFGVKYLVDNYSQKKSSLIPFLVILFAVQIAVVLTKVDNPNRLEDNDNERLYELLSKMRPSNVVVFPPAQPTLDYYMQFSNELKKHNFIGLEENFSSIKNPDQSRSFFYDRIDAIFSSLPAGKFIYVGSHQYPLFADNGPEFLRWRSEYVEKKIIEFNCKYEVIHEGKLTQLLELECKGVG